MNIQLEAAPTELEVEFCELINELLSIENPTLDNLDRICAIKRHIHNFTTFRGGSHIAIHAKMLSSDTGKRLAVITL